MTVRVSVIGSSHLVALKSAFEEVGPPPDTEVRFRGLPGFHFFAIRPGKTSLVIDPSRFTVDDAETQPFWGEVDEEEPYDSFDAMIVVGTMRTHQIMGLLDPEYHRPFYSSAYREATIAQILLEDHALFLANKVRKYTGKPLLFTTAPIPADTSLSFGTPRRSFHRANARIAEAAIRGVRFFAQPMETLNENCVSRPEYAVGSFRLTGERHGPHETIHLNTEYGKIVWPMLLDNVVSRVLRARLSQTGSAEGDQRAREEVVHAPSSRPNEPEMR